VSNCRSCPTEILWLASPSTGRTAPIEAQPHSEGNIRLDLARRQYEVLTLDVLKAARAAGEQLHRNHFMSCPAAKSYLRGGRA
jgi:hypothetical protein